MADLPKLEKVLAQRPKLAQVLHYPTDFIEAQERYADALETYAKNVTAQRDEARALYRIDGIATERIRDDCVAGEQRAIEQAEKAEAERDELRSRLAKIDGDALGLSIVALIEERRELRRKVDLYRRDLKGCLMSLQTIADGAPDAWVVAKRRLDALSDSEAPGCQRCGNTFRELDGEGWCLRCRDSEAPEPTGGNDAE